MQNQMPKIKQSLVKMASIRSNYNNHKYSLVDIIHLLGKKIQTEYITEFMFNNETYSSLAPISSENIFFPRSVIIDAGNPPVLFSDILLPLSEKKKVNLGKDIILPWPQDRKSLIECISTIGEGRRGGKWRQDSNHRIELWLPIGVSWVFGGNHSITAGILQGKEIIEPENIYDISKVYDYVKCDGENYIRKQDGTIISPVNNLDFAVIFEIGRLLQGSV